MSEEEPTGQHKDEWSPLTDADKALVRRELESILEHPVFQTSKRYPSFLRHVVEETLEGRGEQLKERILGVELFAREADYDSTQDNVVRATAAETRKRLAQYYASLEGAREIRIALVTGSYIPKFFRRSPAAESPPRPWTHAGLALLLVAILGGIGAAGWLLLHRPEDSVTSFWRPFLDSNRPILMCWCTGPYESRLSPTSPDTAVTGPLTPPDGLRPNDPFMRFSSALALSRFAAFLASRGKDLHVKDDRYASSDDLKSNPAVLMGINEWAFRLTAPLRFGLRWEPAERKLWISDRQNLSRRNWSWTYADVDNPPPEHVSLITRLLDPSTGQWVVAISGPHRLGNLASLELLSNPEEMQSVAAKAPPGWEKLNLQLVIATRLVQDGPGRPRLLESHFWRP